MLMLSGGDSAGLMLTVTGLVKGSCFGGTFSGGPIGLSSRLRFLFFSMRPLKLERDNIVTVRKEERHAAATTRLRLLGEFVRCKATTHTSK